MLNYTRLHSNMYNEAGKEIGILWSTDHDGEAVAALYVYSLRAGVWSCEYLPQVDEETETEEQDEEPTLCCDECGAELDSDAIEHDGQAFCSYDCLSEAGFIVLEDGDIVPEEDAVFTVDDEWQRRNDCVEIREYRYNPRRTITTYYLEGDDRLVWCEDVQEYRLQEDVIYLHNGEAVSQDAEVCGCEGCGEYFYYEDMHSVDSGCYCPACYEPPVAGADRIYRYSTDVISVCGFAPNPRNVRTYGVELEVEGGDAEEVNDALDGCGILKEDGSLDSGFEIVTRPAPMEETKRVILAAAAVAKESGSKSYNTNTCGFHVHVARKGLSDLRIGKLVAFFQSVDTASELRKVAQRDSSRWAKTGQGLKVTQKPSDRYTALNLQNEHTIEVRIFKGTLDATSLVAYLDFVELVIDWSAVCSLSDCYKWEAFVQYVKDKGGKQGKSLLAWMTKKGCSV